MLALLILVVFGLGMAFFATQNVTATTIILAGNIYHVPLYVVVIGALILGVFVSWLISIVNDLSNALAIHGRDKALQKANQENEELKRRLDELEAEKPNKSHIVKEETIKKETKPSFFSRLTPA